MRLGILLQHLFPYGGLQRDALRLARGAQQARHDATVVVSTSEGPLPSDVRVVHLRSGGLTNHGKLRRFADACQPWLDRFDACIAFSRVPNADVHFCGDPCLRERLASRHGPLAHALPRYRTLLDIEAQVFGAGSPTLILYLSELEAASFDRAYALGPERYRILPPWLSRPLELGRVDIRDEFGVPEGAPIALFVGSDFRRKGLELAIGAVASTPAHLLVCGDDDFAPYAVNAPPGQVHFLGARDDVDRLMRGSDVLLLPSYNETAGMVLTEALARHLPVVCTRNCGYARYVAEAGCAVVPQNPSVSAIRVALLALLANHDAVVRDVAAWAGDPARYRTDEVILDALEARVAA